MRTEEERDPDPEIGTRKEERIQEVGVYQGDREAQVTQAGFASKRGFLNKITSFLPCYVDGYAGYASFARLA